MTTISSYRSADNALLNSLKELKSYGREVTVRGMTTKELLGHSFRVVDPTARFTLLPFRKCNPFAQIAESLWMLSGRDDLDWLELYIPSCKKWSDDGKTWRDAYGPRLRNHGQQYELYGSKLHPVGAAVDQIEEAVMKLQSDIHSRQVILTIWDPKRDWIVDSKAYPCNIVLQFMVRDNRLHMFVTVRSNDVIYGFSHNDFFSWSILHEMMANWVGVEIGSLHWNATSFHIYERHYELSGKIIEHTNPRQFMYDLDVPRLTTTTMFHNIDGELLQLFNWEQKTRNMLRNDTYPGELVDTHYTFSIDLFLDACTRMLMLYVLHKDGTVVDEEFIIDAVGCIPFSDFRIAAIDYLCRDSKYDLMDMAHLTGDDSVYDFLARIERIQQR